MKSLLLSLLLLYSLSATSQIIFDLGDGKNVTETIDLDTKPVIVFKSLLPSAVTKNLYSFTVSVTTEAIPGFDVDAFSEDAVPECPLIDPLIGKLNDVAAEGEVPDKIKALEDALKTAEVSSECMTHARLLIASTTYVKELQFKLKPNQTIKVTVTKVQDGQDVTWTKTFMTEQKTPWIIHYGLNFQPNVISKYNHYYAEQLAADSFRIAKKHTQHSDFWDNLSPTVMFTYPFTKREQDIRGGITAIASTDFTSLSGGVGLSAIIATNIVIVGGITFSQKDVLRGEYQTDGTQTVSTNLNFEQLHEKKWGPEIFFSIGFRFNRNPFSQASAEPAEPDAGGDTEE